MELPKTTAPSSFLEKISKSTNAQTVFHPSKSEFPVQTCGSLSFSNLGTSVVTATQNSGSALFQTSPKFSFGTALTSTGSFQATTFGIKKTSDDPLPPSAGLFTSKNMQSNPIITNPFSKAGDQSSAQSLQFFSKSFRDPRTVVTKESTMSCGAEAESSSTSSFPVTSDGHSQTFSFRDALKKQAPNFSSSSQPLAKQDLKFSTASQPVQMTPKNLFLSMLAKKCVQDSLEKKESTPRTSDRSKSTSSDNSKSISTPESERYHIMVSSQMDVKHLTSVLCKGIHPEDNKKEVLLRHFSRFGKVEKIICSGKQNHAIIWFGDHKSAANAKRDGSLISPIHNPVSIFWCQKSATVKKSKDKKKLDSSEVEDELKAMRELAGEQNLLERPSDEKIVPKMKRAHSMKISTKASLVPKKKKESKRSPPSSPSGASNLKKVLLSMGKTLVKPARTPEDRYAVLEVRDKFMRLKMQKQSDIKKAKAIIGTCPDMCPEKERYSRFTKKTLSSFEQNNLDPLRLEHGIIIKEYSRSSAAQEEPLPHEMRPPESLTLTMEYLLCNLMDKADDPQLSIGEWYDFIWSRTRAIRKDITQQDLCDVACAEIVEKCARFHIHCAAALCEEEMAVFDCKINNENLTKCLQTLKHFYDDLAEKGVHCSNESEFRAYDILLSLNEGAALRHVQNLHIDVRNSPEVRFAVSAAFAFSSNNYVRFFKLLSEATYLNACVMHRYFSEVRVRALQIILKAYCMPNRTGQYPVSDLVDLLKFESVAEAVQFCEMLELKTVGENISLDKTAFSLPVNSLPPNRSYLVVESKRRGISLGEVINREPLSRNRIGVYKPHDSFDSKGCLKKEAFKALDQFIRFKGVKVSKDIEMKPEPVSKPTAFISPSSTIVSSSTAPATLVSPRMVPEPPLQMSLSTSVVSKADIPVIHTTAETNLPIIPTTASAIQPVVTCCTSIKEKEDDHLKERETETKCYDEIAEVILNACIIETISNIVSEVYEDQMRLQEKVRKDAFEKNAHALMESIISDIIQEELENFIREELIVERRKMLNIISHAVFEKILKESVDAFITDIATDVYRKEQQLLQTLEIAKEKMKLFRAHRVFMKWHEICVKRRRMEDNRNTFPSCPTLRFKARSPVTHLLDNPVRASADQYTTSRLLDSGVYFNIIKEELSWLPLDLTSIFENALIEGNQFPALSSSASYWKMFLIYFEDDSNSDASIFAQWLCARFTKGYHKEESFGTTKICSLYWLTNLAKHHIAICVRSLAVNRKTFQSTLSWLKKESLLDGTTAVLVCWPSTKAQNVSSDYQKYLWQILKEKPPVPAVPVWSFTIEQEASSFAARECFEILKTQKLVSNYQVTALDIHKDFYQLSEKVLSAVEWFVQNCPEVPKLVTKYLKDYFQDGIVEVFNIVFHDLSHKRNQNNLYQDPESIITLYNASVEYRASVVSSSSLKSISWPLPEASGFGKCNMSWKSDKVLQQNESILNACTLPSFSGDSLSIADTISYVQSVAALSRKNTSSLFSSIAHLLDKAVPVTMQDKKFLIPWADVIYECALHLYSSQTWVDSVTKEELQACYLLEELENLDLVATWKKISELASTLESCYVYVDDEEALTYPSKRKLTEADEENSTQKLNASPKKQRKSVSSEFENSFQLEKTQSDAFLAMLEQNCAVDLIRTPTGFFESPVHDELSSPDANFNQESDENIMEERPPYSGDLLKQINELKQSIESEKHAEKNFENALKTLFHTFP